MTGLARTVQGFRGMSNDTISKPAEKLTRAQKEAIVMALMHKAGDLVEYWGEDVGLEGVPAEQGIAYLASLMRKMPGKGWDTRIPEGE